MTVIRVRDLDDDVAARLKVRAARHGRSMEAEVRAILTDAVAAADEDRLNLAQVIRNRFAVAGGVDLQIPPRSDQPRAVVVAFDARAARRYGEIVADRERAGRPIASADAQIAAICAAEEATLAEGDVSNLIH